MIHYATKLLSVMLSIALLVGSLCIGQEASLPSAVKDETGHVFEGLAELTIARDAVSQKSAFFAHFEILIEDSDQESFLLPGYHVQLRQADPKFRFIGNCGLLSPSRTNASTDLEHWRVLVQSDGQYRGFNGSVNYRTQLHELSPAKDADNSIASVSPAYFTPHDNLALASNWFFSAYYKEAVHVEDIFLQRARLQESFIGAQGNVFSKWRMKFGDFDLLIEMVQSASFGYLPIEVRYTDVGDPEYLSHVRTSWKKHSGTWVPDVINAVDIPISWASGPTTRTLLKFQWKIGDEVPQELFAPDRPNYRSDLSELFGVKVFTSRPGFMAFDRGEPWVRPEDIEFETPSLLR